MAAISGFSRNGSSTATKRAVAAERRAIASGTLPSSFGPQPTPEMTSVPGLASMVSLS